jgi:hypothetical protein
LLKQVTLRNNSLTSFVNLFYGLFFVESILISFSTNVNNISGMFTNCYSLKYPPLFDTSKVTTISTLFRATAWVHGVITVPAYDLSLCTAYSSTFAGAYNLERFMATGITRGISFVDCNLSATAINEIFTNLGTAAGTQTITVTGNRGAASCTPSIATAKGWTVIV